MSGWAIFFTTVGVSVLVDKFITFVENIGGGGHGRRKRHAAMR